MPRRSILLLGESNVGKSHYGGQLLKRLNKGDGALRMDGVATNIEPFEGVMSCLDLGIAAQHTSSTLYVESVWPVVDSDGRRAELVWPDYGGEQVRGMVTARRVPTAWRQRAAGSSAWLMLVRLGTIRASDDMLLRPPPEACGDDGPDAPGATEKPDRTAAEPPEGGDAGDGAATPPMEMTDQARLIELLQILAHARAASLGDAGDRTRLGVLLTCWDEMGLGDGALPRDALMEHLPMFGDFVSNLWREPRILGLSALSRPLDRERSDPEFASRGGEQFGYVVLEDGTQTSDLTLPIRALLSDDG